MKCAMRARPLMLHQDHVRLVAGVERLAVPVGLEARRDLGHLVRHSRYDGVVARLGQVLRLPIERLHERDVVVDEHRLFVRQLERRIAVGHVHIRGHERLARRDVLLLAAAARRIQHHAHGNTPLARGDHCGEQRGIREQEHLDAQRVARAGDRREDGRRGVVGKYDQCA